MVVVATLRGSWVFIFVVEGLRGMADLGDKLDRQGGARWPWW